MAPEFKDFICRSDQFWALETDRFNNAIRRNEIIDSALTIIVSEYQRGVPLRFQVSFNEAVATMERARKTFQTVQARKGGAAKTRDILQTMIMSIVKPTPGISADELLEKLKTLQAPGETIEDIDDELISFTTPTGQLRTVKVSGLKDRLTRARKSNNAQT